MPRDHFVKRELGCTAYLRYVDDMTLLSESKTGVMALEARGDRVFGNAQTDRPPTGAGHTNRARHSLARVSRLPHAPPGENPQRAQLSTSAARPLAGLLRRRHQLCRVRCQRARLDQSRALCRYLGTAVVLVRPREGRSVRGGKYQGNILADPIIEFISLHYDL